MHSPISNLDYWRNLATALAGGIRYTTDVPLDTLRAFYTSALAKNGWYTVGTEGGFTEYAWEDPQQNSLWNLDLDVSYDPLTVTSTRIEMTYVYWPNLSTLPIYPTASQLHTDTTGSTYPLHLTTTLTYAVDNANLNDIKSYYAPLLETGGWETLSQQGGISYQGADLHFLGYHMSDGVLTWMDLYLTVHQLSKGRALVEIQIVETLGGGDM